MCKEIAEKEIAAILVKAFEDPEAVPWAASQGISSKQAYRAFLRDLGFLVARHFGGIFNEFCDPQTIAQSGNALSFLWDKSVPPGGGVFAEFDTDITVEDWKEESLLRAGLQKYG